MTVFACPIPEVLPVATRGHYIALVPEPTTAEVLDRLARQLLLHGPSEYNQKWEMARHRCYVQVEALLSKARLLEKMDAQRAALAAMNR